MNLGLRRLFSWPFFAAEVSKPIIGVDFLHHFGLIIDLKRRKMIDSATKIECIVAINGTGFERISTINYTEPLAPLLREFIDITKPSPHRKISSSVVTHHVSPIPSRQRRIYRIDATEYLPTIEKPMVITAAYGQ